MGSVYPKDVKRFLSTSGTGEPVAVGPVVDCHQHFWPESFIDELRRRRSGPRMQGWSLLLDGEPPYAVEPGDHDLSARSASDEDDDIDLTLLSLSAPLGIETLDPQQARPLLDAFHGFADEIAAASPSSPAANYGLWASCSLIDTDWAELTRLLHHDRVFGLQVPATAMATPHALERLAPVLALVEAHDLPVLVHPGPAELPEGAVPGWWPAMTSYTAQLMAAWHTWHHLGRPLLPRLRVVFAALAGLAPLHHERLRQRGGTFGAVDHSVFYDTSSYGTRAVDAMVRVVGIDPLVHGSDGPYARATDPGLGDAFSNALFVANPAHLLHGGSR